MRVATIAYFLFYLAFAIYFTLGSLLLDVPIWQRVLGIVTNIAVIICMLLYMQKRRPQRLRLWFKIVPVLMAGWIGLVAYMRATSDTPSTLGVVLFVLVLFPAWYICARFAYAAELNHKPIEF